jgi:hypothetical protein
MYLNHTAMNTLQQINELMQNHTDEQVIFDDPIKVRSAPHQPIFTVYGVWSGSEGLFVLDGGGEWHGPLLPEQQNGQLIINSIYQRIKLTPIKQSVVVADYDRELNAIIFE